ncbi:MAG: dihydrolipoyl dehydrogenase [Salinispira sp.]
MTEKKCDLAIIGAGPGGYVAAIRAHRLGLTVLVIEKDKAGGVCGNWGCIPSKTLLNQATMFSNIPTLEKMGLKIDTSDFAYSKVQAVSRKAATKSGKGVEYLLKKNSIELIKGSATINVPGELRISGGADGDLKVRAKSILIAAGSRPKELAGFEFDEQNVLSSTGILSLKELPSSLIVLGAGAIGMEFAYLMNAFGVQVTIVEMMDHLLPLEDNDVSKVVEDEFKKQGIHFLTGVKADNLQRTKSGISIKLSSTDGKSETLTADKILVAVGRTANTEGLGLENIGIRTEKGFIKVGDYYQTDIPGHYAIGDIIATPLLAHLASKEGETAVEHIAGHSPEPQVNLHENPSAVYTEPGIGSFGLTEEQAKTNNLNYGKYIFPYGGIGKANAIEKTEGLIKIIFDNNTHEIIGAHIVGYCATELIHELLLAKKAELLPEDVAEMIHAHPTISEGIMEAARGVEGWAIHI